MKTIKKLKGLLKAVVFAMLMVFVLHGCDDELSIEKENQKAYKPYKTSFLSKENFKDQPVLDKITFFNKQIAEKKQEKSVHSELYNFTILTEVAFYVEYEDGTSSYTFPIIRAIDNGAQETFVLTTDTEGNYKAQYFSYNFTEEDLTYNGSEDLRDISDKVTIINIEDDDLILEVVQTKCNDCEPDESGTAYGHWETVWNSDWRTYVSTYVIDGYFPTAELDVCMWCGVCPTCDGSGVAGGTIPDSSDNTNYVGAAGTSTIHTITTGRESFGNILLYSGLINHGISINISWIRQSQNNANQAQQVLDFLEEDGNDTPEAQAFAQEIFDLTSNSPFNLDISQINNNILPLPQDNSPEAVKLRCVFKKLTQSPKFKSLFVDTFGAGGTNENFDVKFEIVNMNPSDNDETANASISPEEGYASTYQKQIIKMDRGHLLSDHPLSIAQTIIHEALHAYMNIHQVHCFNNPGTVLTQEQIDDLPQLTMDELLNQFSFDCNNINNSDHRLMYNQMLNVMDEMLQEVLNDLVAPEDLSANFEINSDYDFNWNDAIHYLNIGGLERTIEYKEDAIGYPDQTPQILPNDPNLAFLNLMYNTLVNCNSCNQSFNHNSCN